MCNSILPTFRNRKSRALKSVNKRFSPLKRRSESAASSPHIKLSSVKLFSTSEILNFRSQTLRAARYGGSVRSQTQFGTSVIFLYNHAVNRTYFSDRLAYGKMTFTNVSFVFRRYVIISLSKATNSTQFS